MRMAVAVDTFFLSPDGQGSLQAQIQEMIAQGILSGRFHKGEKLPSSRALARRLGVSRITVTLAYTELMASDYLVSRGRSGYFVSDSAPIPPVYAPPVPPSDRHADVDWDQALPRKFSDVDTPVKPQDWSSYRYPFIYGQADPALFDHANWRLCALRALGQKDFGSLTADYFDQDDPLLIEFIARHTLPRRGITARPEEILITLGAQNALWLCAQVLGGSTRAAALEDPSYYALRDLLRQQGVATHYVPVDDDGMPPDAIPEDTGVIYCTPSHQCPTTATMPLDRRQALLDRAADLDALVVEDDYEFELSFLGAPLPSLKSLDRAGRVIYVGSFSKSLFPGLRLGYLVGAAPFIAEARALRASILRHPPGHIQRTAAYFLSLGHYDAQIRKMGRVLHERRTVMQDAISAAGLRVAGTGVFGGSAFWMQTPAAVRASDLAQRLRARGVLIEPGDPFFSRDRRNDRFYRLAYSSIPAARIADGIDQIAAELATM